MCFVSYIPKRWDFLFSELSRVLKADTNQRQSDRRQTAHTSIARLLNVSLILLSFFTKLLKICFREEMLQGEPPLPTPHHLALGPSTKAYRGVWLDLRTGLRPMPAMPKLQLEPRGPWLLWLSLSQTCLCLSLPSCSWGLGQRGDSAKGPA